MRAHNPALAPESILDLTADSPSPLIIDASRHLDVVAERFPSLQSRILDIAAYLNAIAHEKHALERLRLCELIVETAKHDSVRVEYRAKIPDLRADVDRRSELSEIARDKLVPVTLQRGDGIQPIR